MSWFQALILGIIQGLTEYLPVSSSGHLEIAAVIFGRDALPEESMWFTVLLHAATALSTVVVYRKRIGEIFAGLFSGNKEQWNFSMLVVLSMIPAAMVGLFFEDAIDNLFVGNLLLVGVALIITAFLLYFADVYQAKREPVKVNSALWMGIAQAIAIMPGISRSGATIATGILCKTDKSKAAEFSFLMVIPLILGKMAKDLLDAPAAINTENSVLALGFLAAFVSGIFACTAMIKLVKASSLKYFSLYCVLAATGCIIFHFS